MMIVRPDVTYITSVRQPIGSFDPGPDVMANLNQFSMGPMQFQSGGLGRAPVQLMGVGTWFANLRAKWNNWRHRNRASQVANAASAVAASQGATLTPYGPPAWAASQVMPQMAQQQAMLLQLGPSLLPSQFTAIDARITAGAYGR